MFCSPQLYGIIRSPSRLFNAWPIMSPTEREQQYPLYIHCTLGKIQYINRQKMIEFVNNSLLSYIYITSDLKFSFVMFWIARSGFLEDLSTALSHIVKDPVLPLPSHYLNVIKVLTLQRVAVTDSLPFWRAFRRAVLCRRGQEQQ